MIESLIIMDAFIFTQIINDEDYIEWKALINKLNEEYHSTVYYGEGISAMNVIRCRKCRSNLWNWRKESVDLNCNRSYYNKSYDGKHIEHIHCVNNCLISTELSIELPKNY